MKSVFERNPQPFVPNYWLRGQSPFLLEGSFAFLPWLFRESRNVCVLIAYPQPSELKIGKPVFDPTYYNCREWTFRRYGYTDLGLHQPSPCRCCRTLRGEGVAANSRINKNNFELRRKPTLTATSFPDAL